MDSPANLASLFASGIAWADAPIAASADAMLPEERALVERAPEQRRREFATGRALARKLLAGMGVAATALRIAEHGAPRWPEGIVGSIAHSDTWCVAAIARATELAALGLDIEPLAGGDAGLLELIADERERAWARAAGPGRSDLRTQLLFCAKESFYKCLSAQAQSGLDHQQLEIHFDHSETKFTAKLASKAAGAPAQGRAGVVRAHVVTVTRMALV